MNEIYVTGHRNPDTDSIVAAMSFAALKNALGEKEYVAVHLGTISDETNRMLERFHFNPPRFIQNVRTQVQDLDFDRPALPGRLRYHGPCVEAHAGAEDLRHPRGQRGRHAVRHAVRRGHRHVQPEHRGRSAGGRHPAFQPAERYRGPRHG